MSQVLLDKFIRLSAELCGISEFTLKGTGYADRYFSIVMEIVGADAMRRLLDTLTICPMRIRSFGERPFEPPFFVTRNLAQSGEISSSYGLSPSGSSFPANGTKNSDGRAPDRTFVPFTYAYPEALLWPAVGAHVPGAKAMGYNSWSRPPQFLEIWERP